MLLEMDALYWVSSISYDFFFEFPALALYFRNYAQKKVQY